MSCPRTLAITTRNGAGGASLMIGYQPEPRQSSEISEDDFTTTVGQSNDQRVDVTLEQACAESTPQTTPSRVQHDSLLPHTMTALNECVDSTHLTRQARHVPYVLLNAADDEPGAAILPECFLRASDAQLFIKCVEDGKPRFCKLMRDAPESSCFDVVATHFIHSGTPIGVACGELIELSTLEEQIGVGRAWRILLATSSNAL